MAHQDSDWRAIAVVSRPKTASAMQNGGERPDAECHGSKFGREKEAAIAALLTPRNFEEAARAAGIGTQTLIRWLKIPEFQAAYREARPAAVSESNARLQPASSAAVSMLLKTMVDANAPALTRVRAVDRILERAKRGVENEEIEVRVAALEQTARQRP
jgi:hypothetical protein